MATPTTLPATAVTGDVLTAAYVNALRGAFRVLQVVNASTTTALTNATTTYADTGLTATITPQFTSSKILVLVNQNGGYKTSSNSGNALNVKLQRSTTDISFIGLEVGFNGLNQELILSSVSGCVLDSPSTTAAVTYKTQFANRVNANEVRVQLNAAMSTIILMEISA